MKTLFAASFAVALLGWTGCATGDDSTSESTPAAEDNITFYGEVIDTEGGLDGPALRKALSLTDGRTQVRLEGEITATCPMIVMHTKTSQKHDDSRPEYEAAIV